MSKLNLGQDWALEADGANARTALKHAPSGNTFHFNEDGTHDDEVAKVMNGVVYAGHPDFSTVQAALDFADTNSYNEIAVPKGGYGTIDPYGGQHIFGVGVKSAPHFGGGTSDHAVDMTVNGAGGVILENLKFSTTSGGGTSYNLIHIDGAGCGENHGIRNCQLGQSDNHGLNIIDSNGNPIRYISMTGCHVANSIDGSSVFLGANSDRNLILGNTSGAGWGVTNNGTKNVITDNP